MEETRTEEKTYAGQPQRRAVIHAYQTKKALYKTYQVIWYFLGIIEVILSFRIFLRLLGASTASPFTRFIYDLSYPFASPFFGIVSPSQAEGSLFEWSSLIAMAVYAVVAYGFVYFLNLIRPAEPEEIEEGVENL